MKIKHKSLIAIACALILSIYAYQIFNEPSAPAYQDIKFVDTEKATLSSIKHNISLIGTIRAINSSLLLAQENGIVEIIIKPASLVKKGDLIARIINKDIKKRYELSLVAEEIAKKQFNRATKLLKSNTYSQHQYENSKKELIIAEQALSNAKIMLAKQEIYAPFDGIIGAYKVQTGSHVKADSPIVTIYNPNKIKVEFDVPISAASIVNDGQKLKVLNEEYKLTHIQKALDEETHMCPASCYINCNSCVIGSNVNIDLTLSEKRNIISIPFEAVFLNEGSLSVYIVSGGKTEVRNVTLGIREKDKIEITEGLQVGDEFVTKNPARLYPGVAIKTKE